MSRRMLVLGAVLAPLLLTPVAAQDDAQRKLTDAEQREIEGIDTMIVGTTESQTAANDLSISWVRLDPLMKVPENRQYVPFTVSINPSLATQRDLVVYWRVAAKASPETEATGGGDPDNPDQADGRFPFEDINSVRIEDRGADSLEISRSFAVAPGEYDLHVVIKEPTSNRRNAPAPKISHLVQSVTVPDFWNGDLTTSSIIIAKSIEELTEPLTAEIQAVRPYALGGIEVLPEDDERFSTTEVLQTFFFIYNVKTNNQNKPDVTVEYNFYAKEGTAETFFNKTNPENWNAQTLPPDFDLALGHQLQTGKAVPLASFPEGDYRLEIRITDRVAKASTTRNVNFTVGS